MIRARLSRINIHYTEANRLLNLPQGEVSRLVVTTARQVLRRVKAETPVQDGHMRAANAMVLRVRPYRHVMARIVNTDEAAMWVQTGTGIYGPRRRPITPKRARLLRFYGKRDGALLYLPSVKGQPANPFMLRGLMQGTVASRQRWTIRPGRGVGLIGAGS